MVLRHSTRTRRGRRITLRETWPYHLLILPGLAIVLIYTIIPFFGNVIAFQDFRPIKGFLRFKWIGLENFQYMLQLRDMSRVFRNSLIIACGKLFFSLIISIFFAIALFEARQPRLKKTVQTLCFLPHFLSWVILANVFRNILGDNGMVNTLLLKLNWIAAPMSFLGSNTLFRPLIILTDVWKEFGYGAVIFIAALAGINPDLYEAAAIDGAGRVRRVLHITLPSITVTIVLVTILSLANILNAGFDQIYNLYSPIVYESGDIIDTYVYRMSFLNAQYSLATAVGLMKSAVSFIMITSSYSLARRFAGYRLF
ncbi:MAG: ABC transporter permease subunit [Oscillospiraceae bacterium]|jgi:putative aldouronate transport system permease protein|nr:ABC transporter permease subunit [Oscillospiraceae bacterium]